MFSANKQSRTGQLTDTISGRPLSASQAQSSQGISAAARAAAAARERSLATPILYNRARVEGGLASYSIAPRSNVTGHGQVAQRMGTGGSQAFRRMTQKGAKR